MKAQQLLQQHLSGISLRIRLTLWYTFALSLILVLLTSYLYVQVQRTLMSQVDSALQLAASQALISIGVEDDSPDS